MLLPVLLSLFVGTFGWLRGSGYGGEGAASLALFAYVAGLLSFVGLLIWGNWSMRPSPDVVSSSDPFPEVSARRKRHVLVGALVAFGCVSFLLCVLVGGLLIEFGQGKKDALLSPAIIIPTTFLLWTAFCAYFAVAFYRETMTGRDDEDGKKRSSALFSKKRGRRRKRRGMEGGEGGGPAETTSNETDQKNGEKKEEENTKKKWSLLSRLTRGGRRAETTANETDRKNGGVTEEEEENPRKQQNVYSQLTEVTTNGGSDDVEVRVDESRRGRGDDSVAASSVQGSTKRKGRRFSLGRTFLGRKKAVSDQNSASADPLV